MKLLLYIAGILVLISGPVKGLKWHKVCIPDSDFGGSIVCHDEPIPDPPPSHRNLTTLMMRLGCTLFAEQLSVTGAFKRFYDTLNALNGGLTILCPIDGAFAAFMPQYEKLTAEEKLTLLLFHGIPAHETTYSLRNDRWERTTLATNCGETLTLSMRNEREIVTVVTDTLTAKLVRTTYSVRPLSIFTIDEVLRPPSTNAVIDFTCKAVSYLAVRLSHLFSLMSPLISSGTPVSSM
ncbi:hypothetical protein HHK36_002266 [Tetracentron sinense]|uniref:FAS1 domain-containing protein n=1 Tax=Tetracentron sinense TaxID=13715 RepID=A0A834ZVG9_TETSI|nr:hypothetical protein HHK36_002266 [Tetracentron sinense]